MKTKKTLDSHLPPPLRFGETRRGNDKKLDVHAKGFLMVASSPLTRSSYHAGDDFAVMKKTRDAQLESQ